MPGYCNRCVEAADERESTSFQGGRARSVLFRASGTIIGCWLLDGQNGGFSLRRESPILPALALSCPPEVLPGGGQSMARSKSVPSQTVKAAAQLATPFRGLEKTYDAYSFLALVVFSRWGPGLVGRLRKAGANFALHRRQAGADRGTRSGRSPKWASRPENRPIGPWPRLFRWPNKVGFSR